MFTIQEVATVPTELTRQLAVSLEILKENSVWFRIDNHDWHKLCGKKDESWILTCEQYAQMSAYKDATGSRSQSFF